MYVPTMTDEEWSQLGLAPEGELSLSVIGVGEAKPSEKNGRIYQRVSFRAVDHAGSEPINLIMEIPSATQREFLRACEVNLQDSAGETIDFRGKVMTAVVKHRPDKDQDGVETTKAKVIRFI